MKVVNFKRGLFALTPNKGVKLSESAITAAVKRSGFTPVKIVSPGGKSSQPDSGKNGKATGEKLSLGEVGKLLVPARAAFRKRDFQQAVKLARQIVVRVAGNVRNRHADRVDPAGSDAFQFLSLAEFAAGNYDAAATAAHLALHRGSPWHWKRLSSHYQQTDRYSAQLRALETSTRKKPTADKRFLIGYHYLMLGHRKAARGQFQKAADKNPDNPLISKLLRKLNEGKNR